MSNLIKQIAKDTELTNDVIKYSVYATPLIGIAIVTAIMIGNNESFKFIMPLIGFM